MSKPIGKNKLIWLLAVLAVLVLALVLVLVLRPGEKPPVDATETTASSADTTAPSDTVPEETEPAPALALPCDLGNGLVLEDVITYDGANPDFEDVEGMNIGVAVLKNTSGKHLVSLTCSVTLSDGTVLPFRVMELPDGNTVWAMATDNSQMNKGVYPVTVTCENVSWEDGTPIPEGLTWSAQMTEVTLTNETGSDLTNLTVWCRPLMEENTFMGGSAYSYTLASLGAGESTVISADDCYWGEARVVRVTVE